MQTLSKLAEVATLQDDDRRRLLERFEIVRGLRLMQDASDIFLGWTHGLDTSRHFARAGDPVATAGYLGGDAFDRSITGFCERYAGQNEQDYEEFVKAVRSGRLEAVEGV